MKVVLVDNNPEHIRMMGDLICEADTSVNVMRTPVSSEMTMETVLRELKCHLDNNDEDVCFVIDLVLRGEDRKGIDIPRFFSVEIASRLFEDLENRNVGHDVRVFFTSRHIISPNSKSIVLYDLFDSHKEFVAVIQKPIAKDDDGNWVPSETRYAGYVFVDFLEPKYLTRDKRAAFVNMILHGRREK